MPNPAVSIIVPVYNVEKYLAECLSSVLSQTCCDYELICVNDGATDSSLDILADFLPRFNGKMHIKSQDNAGLSAARNAGLDIAKGKFIYFLDSDDWILPETIQLCVDNINKHDAELLVFNAKAFCEPSESWDLAAMNYQRNLPKALYFKESLFLDMYKCNYIVSTCCYFYKREAFSELRFIPGILHEDHFFSTVLFIESKKTVILENDFFRRRVRAGSIMTQNTTFQHAEGYYSTVEFLAQRVTEAGYNSDFKNVFLKYLNQLIMSGVAAELRTCYHQRQGLSFRRKYNIIRKFADLLNFKAFFFILFPNSFSLLRGVIKRAKLGERFL